MNKNVLAGVLVVVVIGGFYWFQIRPTQIKKECSTTVSEKLAKIEGPRDIKEWQDMYDLSYEKCLNSRGI